MLKSRQSLVVKTTRKGKTNKPIKGVKIDKKKRNTLLAKLRLLKLRLAKKKINQKQKQNQKQEVIVNNIINATTRSKRRRKSYRKEEKLEDKLKDKPTPAVFTSLATTHNRNTMSGVDDLNKAKYEFLQNRNKELETLRIANSAFGTQNTQRQITQGEATAQLLLKEQQEDEADEELKLQLLRAEEAKLELEESERRVKLELQALRVAQSREKRLNDGIMKTDQKLSLIEKQLEEIDPKVVQLKAQIENERSRLQDPSFAGDEEEQQKKINQLIDEFEDALDDRDRLTQRAEQLAAVLRTEELEIEKQKRAREEAEKRTLEEKEKVERAKQKEIEEKQKIDELKQKRVQALKKGTETRKKKADDEKQFYAEKVESYKDMSSLELQDELAGLEPFDKESARYKAHVKTLEKMIERKQALEALEERRKKGGAGRVGTKRKGEKKERSKSMKVKAPSLGAGGLSLFPESETGEEPPKKIRTTGEETEEID